MKMGWRDVLWELFGVWGPLGQGRELGRGDAYRFLQLDLFQGFLPEHFLDTLSYLCLVQHSTQRYPPKNSVIFCRLILWSKKCSQERPNRVPEWVGIGRSWALYNKRYLNDLPPLEKSDMKSPKFDIRRLFCIGYPIHASTKIKHLLNLSNF